MIAILSCFCGDMLVAELLLSNAGVQLIISRPLRSNESTYNIF
jgi:hypothetical protein